MALPSANRFSVQPRIVLKIGATRQRHLSLVEVVSTSQVAVAEPSKVAIHVHSLVEDPYDIDDVVSGEPVEQHMGPAGEFAVARPDLIAHATDSRIRDGTFDGVLKFAQVVLRLVDAPVFCGVFPNVFDVSASGWRE